MVSVIHTYQGQPILPGWHYIGRQWAGFSSSIFHNPFHVGKDGDRKEVLFKFIAYWYSPENRDLRKHAVKQIRMHDILMCWCKPLDCHGDIIAGYVNWKISQAQMEFCL
jgi:Domain of unknown function (DUF4326)